MEKSIKNLLTAEVIAIQLAVLPGCASTFTVGAQAALGTNEQSSDQFIFEAELSTDIGSLLEPFVISHRTQVIGETGNDDESQYFPDSAKVYDVTHQTAIRPTLFMVPLSQDTVTANGEDWRDISAHFEFGPYAELNYGTDEWRDHAVEGHNPVVVLGAFGSVSVDSTLYATLNVGAHAQDVGNGRADVRICYLPFANQNFRTGVLLNAGIEFREEDNPWMGNSGRLGVELYVAKDFKDLTFHLGPNYNIVGDQSRIGLGGQVTLHLGSKARKDLEGFVKDVAWKKTDSGLIVPDTSDYIDASKGVLVPKEAALKEGVADMIVKDTIFEKRNYSGTE